VLILFPSNLLQKLQLLQKLNQVFDPLLVELKLKLEKNPILNHKEMNHHVMYTLLVLQLLLKIHRMLLPQLQTQITMVFSSKILKVV
jgi:hypothetical protein